MSIEASANRRPVDAVPAQPGRGGDVSSVFTPFVLGWLLAGLAALYVPTYLELAKVVWSTDEQGHGPIILAVSVWMLFSRRHKLVETAGVPSTAAGVVLLAFGLLLYMAGRSQHILLLEVSSQIALLASLILLFLGRRALRQVWFPLFFLIFMIPLPEALVAAVTAPLKSAVSMVASSLLYHLGYPVGRAGVVMSVGPYQLMVADACAGLNSMFTLEALGLFYMNLMQYTAVWRNVALAVLVVPIAFAANVARVIVLVLVTYYFGDEAGQGFVHGFAGMVLFLVGLCLLLVADKLLGLISQGRGKE